MNFFIGHCKNNSFSLAMSNKDIVWLFLIILGLSISPNWNSLKGPKIWLEKTRHSFKITSWFSGIWILNGLGICSRYRVFEILRVNCIRLDIFENSPKRETKTAIVSSRCLSSFLNFFQLCEVPIIWKSFTSLALTKYLNVRTSQTTHVTTLQRGLEISCKATIRMSDTIRNRNLIVKYSKIIELLHVEPSSPATIGSFLYKNNGNDNELYKINCR